MDLGAFVRSAQQQLRSAAENETPESYGLKSAARKKVFKSLTVEFPPRSTAAYRDAILALWALPHKEEKQLAIDYADAFHRDQNSGQIDLYIQLVREGSSKAFADPIVEIISRVYRRERSVVRPVVLGWRIDGSLWVRRTSMLSQKTHGEDTDEAELFETALCLASENDVVMKKAIGVALRTYAGTSRQAVSEFVNEHGSVLSSVTVREAMR